MTSIILQNGLSVLTLNLLPLTGWVYFQLPQQSKDMLVSVGDFFFFDGFQWGDPSLLSKPSPLRYLGIGALQNADGFEMAHCATFQALNR